MKKTIIIKDKIMGKGQPCFIIAEAGVNHNGSLEIAKKLIDVAVDAKADAVKFQTYKTEELILDGVEKAEYQKAASGESESQTEMLKRLEIDKEFHVELLNHCAQKGILFLSTCYEETSLNLLMDLDVPVLKIASTDTTNYHFLEKVAKCGKPVILSTGMCSQKEIERAYQCLQENGCKELALLKCTSNYPTSPENVNLSAICTMRDNFDAVIGFSDHTVGVGATPYAVALGAKVAEKHFTIDKSLAGPDHQASLSPEELKQWVCEIRKVEKMMGSPGLIPTNSEIETKKKMQKYIVSKMQLSKGEIISRNNITAKRTGGRGISINDFYGVLGKELQKNVPVNQPIYWEDLG